MDINHYSNFYSYNELINNLDKINIKMDFIKELNNEQLFNFAIKNAIGDLVEYLYIHCGVEYELTEIIDMNTPSFIKSENSSEERIPVDITIGANIGINLDISGRDKKINIIVKNLINMRKYSKMRSKNKKFWYKFNKKYINKFS